MNNTIPFHSATHAPQITVDVNILSMLKQAASCLTEMASENVYLAAILQCRRRPGASRPQRRSPRRSTVGKVLTDADGRRHHTSWPGALPEEEYTCSTAMAADL